MKTFRTTKGPFIERPYFTKNEIEVICNDALHEMDLFPSRPQPIRIDRFIEKKFITLKYEDLPDGVLGLTRFSKEGVKEVVVSALLDNPSDKVTERRLRSTLAHEAGHGLLHAHLFAIAPGITEGLFGDYSEPESPKVLCRGEAIHERSAYRGQWWEYQANQAIGALLMPAALVNSALDPFIITGSLGSRQFDFTRVQEALLELVRIFDVNRPVAQIRLEELFPAASDGQLML